MCTSTLDCDFVALCGVSRKVLEEHRAQCQKNGQYAEAEVASKRLAQLKLEEQNRRKEALRGKHIEQRLEVEEHHKVELKAFNTSWKERFGKHKPYHQQQHPTRSGSSTAARSGCIHAAHAERQQALGAYAERPQ